MFVSTQGGRHGPRVKFLNKYSTKWTDRDSVSLTISDDPQVVYPKTGLKLRIKQKEFKQIKQWIIQNKEVLLDFWYCELPRN